MEFLTMKKEISQSLEFNIKSKFKKQTDIEEAEDEEEEPPITIA